MLLIASYYFYASWDVRFLALLAFSTALDYYSGVKIFHSKNKKKRYNWLILSILANLSFLGFFKYYNFFIDNFKTLLTSFDILFQPKLLEIILPVGISFYTLHGLSYVFDLYRKKINPAQNLLNYALFVSFFPLLVAGPIERANHLLPQIERKRHFNYAQTVSGMQQFLWGLFKKIVIADNCAAHVNIIFENQQDYSGSTLILGAILFSFQIYGDFSGYSDMALGTARLLGFELLKNFNFPYFSRNINEFWRRWHISLSSWLRDYVYIPLGGNKGSLLFKMRNILLVFGISGLWHGANWTFILWGLVNGLMITVTSYFEKKSDTPSVFQESKAIFFKDLPKIIFTFSITTATWILFRANSLTHALQYYKGIFSKSFLSIPSILPKTLLILIVIFIIVEWIGRKKDFAIAIISDIKYQWIRWFLYALIIFALGMYCHTKPIKFIYFQF